jgi:hypothetical protein
MKKYSPLTVKNCLRVRYQYGNSDLHLPFLERHKRWVEFVEKSNLINREEKDACIDEFINPKDLERYRGLSRDRLRQRLKGRL